MKQKSIQLLDSFLNSQIEVDDNFSFQITPVDDYDDYWHFSVKIIDGVDGAEFEMEFRVSYKDEFVFLKFDQDYEQVDDHSWRSKYFWYKLYCLK